MRLSRMFTLVSAAGLSISGLAACSTKPEALCTDPLGEALAALSSEADSSTINPAASASASPNETSDDASAKNVSASANAQELASCVAEAMGTLKGYEQETIAAGFKQLSRVNVNPLKVNMSFEPALDNGLSEVIMIEGFVFAKQNGQWIEATEDNSDPIIKDLLNLPKSFQTQFNPKLRAAGTDNSIHYTVTSKDQILGKPVLVLEAPITSEQDTYISRYYLDADYELLRSETVTEDGKVTSTSAITELNTAQSITNPLLPEK